jgi:hypothetical protein
MFLTQAGTSTVAFSVVACVSSTSVLVSALAVQTDAMSNAKIQVNFFIISFSLN